MALQIQGKFIQDSAIDGDKLKLSTGQAIKLVKADGTTEVRLIELDEATGKVKVNGVVVALEPALLAEIANREAADTALSTAMQALIQAEADARIANDALLIPLAQKGVASGVATLDATGKVPASQIPPIAITSVAVVATIAERDALSPQEGDFCVVTGVNETFIYNGTGWIELLETSGVVSVNGQTGAVSLSTSDISEGTNLYFNNARAQAAITGGASSIVTANLALSRALVSDASGKVSASFVTSTQLGYLSGVTGAIQTQIDGKVSKSGDTVSGVVNLGPYSPVLSAEFGVGFTPLNAINSSGGFSSNIFKIVLKTTDGNVPRVNGIGANNLDLAQSYIELQNGSKYYASGVSGFADGIAAMSMSGPSMNLMLNSSSSGVFSFNVSFSGGWSLSINSSSISVSSGAQTGIYNASTAPYEIGFASQQTGPQVGGTLRFLETTGNGTNYVGFKAANSIAANVEWTLPSVDGSANQVLSTNGSGTLSWANSVTSINGQTGVATLTTSNISEGTNLYYTDGRAKAAAVVNTSAGNETDQAMSVVAGKSYTDSAVAAEATIRLAADSALDARLDVIEGPESQAGSIAKALKDAKDYVNDVVGVSSAAVAAFASLATQMTDGNAATGVISALGSLETRVDTVEAGLAQELVDRAAADTALDGRLDVLEARLHRKMKFTLTATDITNGYIELAHEAMANSIVASVGRLMIHEGVGEDFTVSVVANKTRMTFVGNLVAPSEEQLAAGDVIYVKYMNV